MFSPSSNIYTFSTVLFYKYRGENVSVANCMSHFSMFILTKSTMEVANVNTGHAQVNVILLCCFDNYPIKNTMQNNINHLQIEKI